MLACRTVTSGTGSRRRALIAVLIALGLAVAAERGRWFGSLMTLAAPERLWIWSRAWPGDMEPQAFFLVRDFDLAGPPASAALAVAGDPEYIARLNGRRIGSNLYSPGSAIDVYDVGAYLRPGRNRLLLELRSPIGIGGATVRLADGGGRTLVASDGEWSVFSGSWRALTDLERPLPPAPQAAVLGASPLARWGVMAEARLSRFDELSGASGVVRARRWRRARGGAPWGPLPRRSRRPFTDSGWIEIDFGRVVHGYLHLDLARSEPAAGMVFFADLPGAPVDRDPDRVVVAVPHLGFWSDAEPRSFRYATLVGLTSLLGVSAVTVRAEEVPQPTPLAGLFGLRVGAARSPLIEELRRGMLGVEAGDR